MLEVLWRARWLVPWNAGRRAPQLNSGSSALATTLCAAVLNVALCVPAVAQTGPELQAAAARLAARTLTPLPDGPANRDVGQIAVIEWDGSNYDRRLPDGSLNYEARTRVGRKFYETHHDDYDFLVVLTNFEFDTEGAAAFLLGGRNDVEGTGKPVGDVGADVFGSASRLKGWIDLTALSRYDTSPYSTEPGGAGFVKTLDVLAHELGHQWLAEARFVDSQGRISSDLLGEDETHWSYLLDSDGSLYYGADWREEPPGSFTAVRVRRQYSALDLYLMGFLPPAQVPAFTLLRNEAVDRHGIVSEGDRVSATSERVTIDQVIAAMGPRRPDWRSSQKEFRVGFVFLARPGSEPTADELAAVEGIRRAFGPHFFALTRGVAWADTALSSEPGLARSPAPDLDRAAAWLQAAQGLDGTWADSGETRVRDTAAALRALFLADVTGPGFQRGLAWLQAVRPASLDAQSRAGAALAATSVPDPRRLERLATLLAVQNADGGFGAGTDFVSDALDTGLALRAMKALGHTADQKVGGALAALQSLANPDGGFSGIRGGETSTLVTAEALLAVQDWRDVPAAQALEAHALVALLSRRNADGGFGTSPSAPHATALALMALLRTGSPPEVVDAATAWLEQNQLADGSWNGSAYETALVLESLRTSVGANLVVPADSLVIDPNPAREGSTVHVSAHVRNAGRAPAPATLARLFDGDPAAFPAIGEQAVPPLPPGEEAAIVFEFDTSDRAGKHTLYVVADAAEAARESREDDNAASRLLTVEGPLPDLVVTPPDLLVTPSSPAPDEASRVAVTVRNAGERASTACIVSLVVTDPQGAAALTLLDALPPLPPGAAATVEFDWVPTSAGTYRLRAIADSRFAVSEADETNNGGERAVSVADAPAQADLALSDATASPSVLSFVPQAVDLRFVALNLGREAADTVVRVYADETREVVLGEVPVSLGPRDSRAVSLRVAVTRGEARTLVIVADPDWRVSEADKANNTLLVTLADGRTTDLEVVEGTATLPAEVMQGDRVSLEVTVRNRGTRPVLEIPVQAADEAAGRELARATVALASGEARTVSLEWVATVPEDDLRVLVRVDPFDLLAEAQEDNNAVTLHLRVRESSLPNLVVSGADVRLSPEPLVEGEPGMVTVSVRNDGSGSADPCIVRFYVGDPDAGGTLLGQSALPALLPGAAAGVSASWPRVDVHGSLGMFVIVDPDDAVREVDEADNRAFRPFHSTGLPDLVLSAADLVLSPGYPRVGETVSVRLTVRNLGERPSAETSVSLAEGKLGAETPIGALTLPALVPGAFATLSLEWSPASPPGDRRLFAVVDPEDLVVESDEANEVRRKVVVQDADLYLTEPFFSPNGDGVKDETTLSWRATGAVTAVVASARGETVRTLIEDGPASGSATWDGRDAGGRIASDGRYSLVLLGEEGRVIGEVPVELDTNRSAIHDSTPHQRVVRNLSCALPASGLEGPQWLPGDDAVLFLVREVSPGFPVGLLRVELDGSYRYLAQDPWLANVSFPQTAAVSPEGREVLVQEGYSALHAVDLVTGTHRSLGSGTGASVAWSPDGRFILKGNEVVSRDGAVVASLDWGGWVWSPSSDRLAGGLSIRGRDGSVIADLPPEGYNCVQWTSWRPDGKIMTVAVDDCESGEWPQFLVDPEARTAVPMASWHEWQAPAWSPDGSRFISPTTGDIRLADGTTVGRLVRDARVSPGGAAISYRKSIGDYDADRPGAVCSNRYEDFFALSTTANLTANLDVAILPANKGVLLRGTASDRNLEHFEVEFATTAEPAVWHPIGPSFDSSVVDGELVSWVPPGPGTYVVRLVVVDRAGNEKVRVRTVSWDRVPRLANFTQSEAYVSPNGDGVKDEVTFRYLVLEPTRLDVRIAGPASLDASSGPGPVVRRVSLEYPAVGPREFTWDGRDESGRVVPDGRYSVLLDDVPFTVEVDSTPPEIGMRFEALRAAEATLVVQGGREAGDDCRVYGLRPPAQPSASGSTREEKTEIALSSIAADRVWHVVDGALDEWRLDGGGQVLDRGTDGVFAEPPGASGPVLAGAGPDVPREAGRPVERRQGELISRYLGLTDLSLEATDLAGNTSRVAVDPIEEALVPLGAESRCRPLAPILGPEVAALEPEKVTIQVGATLRNAVASQALRLAVRPDAGGASLELPFDAVDYGGHRNLRVDAFASAGLDPIGTYRAVVKGTGESGEVTSPEFRFSPCQEWLSALRVGREVPGRGPVTYLLLRGKVSADLVSASGQQWREDPAGRLIPEFAADLQAVSAAQVREWFGLDFTGESLFMAEWPKPDGSCVDRLRILARAQDSLGRSYPNPNLADSCQRLTIEEPPDSGCPFRLDLDQQFPGCAGSPDFVDVRASWLAATPARVTIEAGPPDRSTVIDTFDFDPVPSRSGDREYRIPVRDQPDGPYPVTGHLVPLDPALEAARSDVTRLVAVDRTAPQGQVLLPPENGSVCATSGSLTTRALVDDASPRVGVEAAWRKDGAPWVPLARICSDDACREDPTVPSGRPFDLAWDAAALESGWYDLQLSYCDRSGNRSVGTRRVLVSREPPALRALGAQRPVFSPNGDGRVDDTVVTVRLASAVRLTGEVRRGGAAGPLVRTLFADRAYDATDVAVPWDGRDDGGAPVTEGAYAVVFSAADACGASSTVFVPVSVDTTPPLAAITDPPAAGRVAGTVDVRGQATDPHLATWRLDVTCGAEPSTLLEERGAPVAAGEILARWDTSRGPPGDCQLKLVAEDEAGNVSADVVVPVTVERGERILRLSASPDIFSPNGDDRRETVRLDAELALRSRVSFEIRDVAGRTVRRFEQALERDPGAWSVSWDGSDDAGAVAADGDYVAWLRAEDPSTASVSEERSVGLTLDRTAPTLAVSRPAEGEVVPTTSEVVGTIEDAHLLQFRLEASTVAGLELAHGAEPRKDVVLAALSALPDGPNTLVLSASDRAENEAHREVSFVVDSKPPRAAIQSPVNGALVKRGDDPVAITGVVADDHPRDWTLRYGAGEQPADFVAISGGTSTGNGIALGGWDVRFVPDGVYALSLVATDAAGQSTEARTTVRLDGTPPVVALTSVEEGGYLTAAGPLLGTANDANLASWQLEVAPGPRPEAYRWSLLDRGESSVEAGTLATWAPLPADGTYTLRLTARDSVGLEAELVRTVVVDTTAPAPPADLARALHGRDGGTADVRLTWRANTEADLAGYRIYRDGSPLAAALLTDPSFTDAAAVEGRYEYSVVAVDRAGNASEPSRLVVAVDVTPPSLSFISPSPGAAVSGEVDVQGTAFSADDFAEYRLLVGAGSAPTSWTLVRRSTVSVAAGPLGEWLALVDGQHSLALEADDTHGNSARIVETVVVDTQPPAAPVLVDVDQPGVPADRLVPSWSPSPSSDVEGYLVYRDGRIANASGLVVGDRRGYLVPGPSLVDEGLPDGRHCYQVVAMDQAGNTSMPSNEVCRSLDNRPPHALIVQPADGARFELTLSLLAETPDLDVASVQFQQRREGEAEWRDVGATRATAPWVSTLDPSGLSFGTYELRAVATDAGGATDPAPVPIRVVYGDTTAPPAPENLVARVTGGDVALTWTAPAATDVASYGVYRDGQKIAADVAAATHTDAGRPPASYAYAVTAVDADGNESPASASATAVVYAPTLDPPAWPVTSSSIGSLTGDGARAQTTIQILRDGTSIGQTFSSAGGSFVVPGLPLIPDGNLFFARADDASGNRSLTSDPVVLITNVPPGIVGDPVTTVSDRDVHLSWAAPADADVFGYVVRRDGEKLTRSRPQRDSTARSATVDTWLAAAPFDGNPGTFWPYSPATGSWTVELPATVMVSAVRVRFAPSAVAAAFTVEARWRDRFVPLIRVRGNTQAIVEGPLPSPFATTALRVTLEAPGQLAEVDVERLDVVPAGTLTYLDAAVRDGRRAYAVSAIDVYGAEGPETTVTASVGDIDPPAAPAGLVAVVVGREVRLAWTANAEPDLAGYVVLRDGLRVGESSGPSFRDVDVANGAHGYTVIAVDRAGLESDASEPASVVVDADPSVPAAPEILEPTSADQPIALASPTTDVGGRAPADTSVTIDVDGQTRGASATQPGFLFESAEDLPATPVALSPDGTLAAYYDWSTQALTVRGLSEGPRSYAVGPIREDLVRISPDDARVAFGSASGTGGIDELRLADGAVRRLVVGTATGLAWSASGDRLAAAVQTGTVRLVVVDVASGTVSDVDSGGAPVTSPSWSPDGRQIAFFRRWGTTADLHLVDPATGEDVVLDFGAWDIGPPAWSADSRRVAWTSGESGASSVWVYDVSAGVLLAQVAEADVDVRGARLSPDGSWLSFARVSESATGRICSLVARRLDGGLAVDLGPKRPCDGGAPPSHEWTATGILALDGQRLERYRLEPTLFRVREVALHPGTNRIVARATDSRTGLVSPDSEAITIKVAEASFADLSVAPADVLAEPAMPHPGEPASLRVRVQNGGDLPVEMVDVRVSVSDPAGARVVDSTLVVPVVSARSAAWVQVPFVPVVSGAHRVEVTVDPYDRVPEARETNNEALQTIEVVVDDALVVTLSTDRAVYGPDAPFAASVRIANPGRAVTGTVRTTIEDESGGRVALLEERPLALEYGRSAAWDLFWNTGGTWAGRYAVRVRIDSPGGDAPIASAERAFDVVGDLVVRASVGAQPAAVRPGAAVQISTTVLNLARNRVLAGGRARLRVSAEGTSAPPAFETLSDLPMLVPGGAWSSPVDWTAAGPAGRYTVQLDVEASDGVVLASASSTVVLAEAAQQIVGTLDVRPADVLAGATAEARATLTNVGVADVSGYPFAVDVVSGPAADVHLSVPATVSLAVSEARTVPVSIETGALAPGPYVLLLRGGLAPTTLDRAPLRVHGVIAPPSPDTPADGGRVDSPHPLLVVNDASSADASTLRYEFQLFGDAALTQPLPGATGVPETPSRTAWGVVTALAEDATYWWRARATDGFSTSAWSAVSRFTVDAVDLPPSAPFPLSPASGDETPDRQPTLTVRNGSDPEARPLTYEFQVSSRADMSDVLVSAVGVAEGPGTTAWTPPLVLGAGAGYYWRARTKDAAGLVSPWSVTLSFSVVVENHAPTAPLPVSPVAGETVRVARPPLVAANAVDPDGDPLSYRFETDTSPAFDSSALQTGDVPSGDTQTSWVPPQVLAENSVHYWRVTASDGAHATTSTIASFFVNAVNEPPGPPTLLDPVDGRTVGDATPLLHLRNAADPDLDPLTYEIEVRDASGAIVAATAGLPAGAAETEWRVSPALAEDDDYTWAARASDGAAVGPWSAAASFRVDAVVEPPSAPEPLLPADGAVVSERQPALVVLNATSPDRRALTYTFEIDTLAEDGTHTPADRAAGIPEGTDSTSWTTTIDLADGRYAWRARASDAVQDGPWSPTRRFDVVVDPPPAPPTGLRAVAGDARVRLDWTPSPEADVTGYVVYRTLDAGGPYDALAAVSVPSYDDLAVSNGTTYYYAVAARDALSESARSAEVSARPAAPTVLVADVRFDPESLSAGCLGVRLCPSLCPEWLYAVIELEPGLDPASIEIASLRALGDVPADPGYGQIGDADADGKPDLRVRFRLELVAVHLSPGENTVGIVGRAGGVELEGTARIDVVALAAEAWTTPRTIQRRSNGQDVQVDLSFPCGADARRVAIDSIRLDGVVPVDRVVNVHADALKVKFDRSAVIGVLPAGPSVEVRITGTIDGQPFLAVDHVKVIE